ncbi:MAG: DNA helicase II [Gammaproteobacteria bacterium]|nr:DNA helicase II [Gammaproteobacteria bacterium]
MDVSRVLDPLNDAQRQAVCAPAGHIQVLAGAGSGKTRVLVHRIAWLLQAEGVSPYGILAVTFTNKAAGEMRSRIEELLGIPASGLWVGTFHGIAHRLLRAHWKEANLPQGFQILDSEDQLRSVRRVIREMGLDENHYPPKETQWYINGRKDEGQRPDHIDCNNDPHLRQKIEIYRAYEAMCQRNGVVDFAELLLRAHELWLNYPQMLQHYQQRFHHILVDEFQDTNTIQYAWLRMLAGDKGCMFAVGDDDQSIYGWRGARVENIHQFSKDYANTSIFRLEQNYRSTGNILKAANSLIENNTERMGKNLWTEDGEGEKIRVYGAYNDLDEANYIAEQILSWIEDAGLRSECALLYRSNAQSRVLEEALIKNSIPYRVYGGLRFFERQEIKDALAYLRLMNNDQDDAALERIINTPTRGIGNRTVEAVREMSRSGGMSMWQALWRLQEEKTLPARALGALSNFIDIIEELKVSTQELGLGETIEHVIHHSRLRSHYEKEKGEKGRARIENLEELVNAGRSYSVEDFDDELPEMDELSAFLSHASLEAGDNQADEWDDCVQLMTLHTAKGLEFKQVFLCGVEEDLFPHRLSADDPVRLEEERRLCYVGMTRAMQRLTLCYAEKRRLYGDDKYTRPSRFIKELPAELIEEVRMQGYVAPAMSASRGSGYKSNIKEENETGLNLGQRVMHQKFGEGIVMNYEGQGRHARVQVNFEGVGSKWLVMEYANLMLC